MKDTIWFPGGSNRLDPAEKRLPSKLFNLVTAKMSGIDLHDFDCGYKAYRREVTDAVDIYGQLHRYIPVLAFRKGFRIAEIQVHHNKRKHGKSKYGVERYMQGLLDFFTVSFLSKYHDRPMYFFGRTGLLSLLLGGAICLFLTVIWCMAFVAVGDLVDHIGDTVVFRRVYWKYASGCDF